jgi:hypothetical protein
VNGDAKSLSTGYIPLATEEWDIGPHSHLATDIHAVQRTGHHLFCLERLPTGGIHWGHASTGGACHFFDFDHGGECTFVIVVCGLQLWVVAEPHDEDDDSLTSIRSFAAMETDLATWNWDLWYVEAVVLEPGDLWRVKLLAFKRPTF